MLRELKRLRKKELLVKNWLFQKGVPIILREILTRMPNNASAVMSGSSTLKAIATPATSPMRGRWRSLIKKNPNKIYESRRSYKT